MATDQLRIRFEVFALRELLTAALNEMLRVHEMVNPQRERDLFEKRFVDIRD